MTISITNSSQKAAQVPSEMVILKGSFMAQTEWAPLADGEFVIQAQANGVHSGNQTAKVLPEGSFLDKNNDRIKTPLTVLKAYLLSPAAISASSQQNAIVLQATDKDGNLGHSRARASGYHRLLQILFQSLLRSHRHATAARHILFKGFRLQAAQGKYR